MNTRRFKVGDKVIVLDVTHFDRSQYVSAKDQIGKIATIINILLDINDWHYYVSVDNIFNHRNLYVFEDQIKGIKEYEKMSDKNKDNVINLINV